MHPTGDITISEMITSIVVSAVAISTYLFMFEQIDKIRQRTTAYDIRKFIILKVISQRIAGLIILGIIPALIGLFVWQRSLSHYGINGNNLLATLFWVIALSLLIIPLCQVFSKNPSNTKVYPQIRIKEWSGAVIWINIISWGVYLFGYEFLFRGFLLITGIPILGILQAIAVSTLFYSLAHIPKGLKETIAAIPFGLILCFITIETQNIWAAFFAHLVLAISNDFVALRAYAGINIKPLTKKWTRFL